MTRITLHRARTAKAAVLKQFRRLPNLSTVGISKMPDGYAVKINLTEPMPDGTHLPGEIEGVPVKIEVGLQAPGFGPQRPRATGLGSGKA
jgi:hypothetical protein